ncbi:hypothetical protein GCM10029978_041020 [Actinoallomurus acanthiterrae]
MALGGSNTASGPAAATMNFGVPAGRRAGYTDSFGTASGFCAAIGVAAPDRTGGSARSAWPPLQPVSANAATITDDTESRTARPWDVIVPPFRMGGRLARPKIGSSSVAARRRKDGGSE